MSCWAAPRATASGRASRSCIRQLPHATVGAEGIGIGHCPCFCGSLQTAVPLPKNGRASCYTRHLPLPRLRRSACFVVPSQLPYTARVVLRVAWVCSQQAPFHARVEWAKWGLNRGGASLREIPKINLTRERGTRDLTQILRTSRVHPTHIPRTSHAHPTHIPRTSPRKSVHIPGYPSCMYADPHYTAREIPRSPSPPFVRGPASFLRQ